LGKLNYEIITLIGTVQAITIGINMVKEYPYIHNTGTKPVSLPKHFIIIVIIIGKPNPIPYI